jgi:hypothetical protein
MTVGVGNELISCGGSAWTKGDGDKTTGGAVTTGGEDTMTESDVKKGGSTMTPAPNEWKK